MSETLAQVRRTLRPVAIIVLVGALLVGFGPVVLDSYSVNVLTRSLLYAAVALTVDLLWGYMGILTFGQSAFFAIGAYTSGLIFTHIGFSPWLALAAKPSPTLPVRSKSFQTPLRAARQTRSCASSRSG